MNGSDKPGDKRKELRDQLDAVKKEQATHQEKRNAVLTQVKATQDSLKRKMDEIKNARDKLAFKSAADLERRIVELEALVSSGSMKLIDEKRTLSDISALRRQLKQFDTFGPQELAIDNDKRRLEELKAQLATFDPENQRLKKAFGEIIGQLKAMDAERNESQSQIRSLFAEKDKFNKELNDLYQKRRDLHTDYYGKRDEFNAYMKFEKERRAEQYRKEREEMDRQKRLEKVRRAVEQAEIPAFEAELLSCINLTQLLRSFLPGASAQSADADETPATSSADSKLRQVSDNLNLPKGVKTAVVLKKKSDRIEEDDVFFVGKAKSSRKNKSAEQTKEKEFKLDLSVMEQFWSLKIEVPTKSADIPKALEDLDAKKKYFLDNQARVTAENLQKAKDLEARLLKEEEERKAAPAGAENGASPVATSPVAEEDKSDAEDTPAQ